MRLSDYVMGFLAGEGVRDIFLVPGGGNMYLVDSAARQAGLAVTACLHEQAAAIAADGYAQYTGNLGVALVTTGPGGTNAVTGVAGAWTESTPLLILSGQVKTADIKPNDGTRTRGFQEIDIVSVVHSITKYAVTVKESVTIRYHLEKAAWCARTGRKGPVWIDIPLDVQKAEIEPTMLRGFTPPPKRCPSAASVGAWAALEMIAQAERPVILAGHGIKSAKSESLFRECIAQLGVPVLTTWRAADLVGDDHPLYFGRPGAIGQPGANLIVEDADLLVAIGARLDFGQIGYDAEYLDADTKKVIVDVDPCELAKHRFPVTLAVEADAGTFLAELYAQLPEYRARPRETWLNKCRSWKDLHAVDALVDILSRFLTPDDLLVPCSSGSGANVFMRDFRVKFGQRVLNSPGFGAMGYDIPQSIGACLASGRRTVCLAGDGGFQLNIQELETVQRLGLPIKFFYLNNGGYASIRATQRKYFDGRFVASDPASGLTFPDISSIAEAYLIRSNVVEGPGELEERVREALDAPGPFICEVMGDRS
jgi:acetolactate synthase-1/2/3 large subunit